MSNRWRNTALLLAGIAFAATLAGSGRNDLLANLHPVVQAAINAVVVFVAVWLYEAIYRVALRIRRAVVPGRPPADEPR